MAYLGFQKGEGKISLATNAFTKGRQTMSPISFRWPKLFFPKGACPNAPSKYATVVHHMLLGSSRPYPMNRSLKKQDVQKMKTIIKDVDNNCVPIRETIFDA